MVKLATLVLVSMFIGWVLHSFYIDETTLLVNENIENNSNIECEDVSPKVIEKK